MPDLTRELDYWRGLAIYLADCHAATAEREGTLSSCSASRRDRFVNLLASCRDGLNGNGTTRTYRSIPEVVDRCFRAEVALKKLEKP